MTAAELSGYIGAFAGLIAVVITIVNAAGSAKKDAVTLLQAAMETMQKTHETESREWEARCARLTARIAELESLLGISPRHSHSSKNTGPLSGD